MVREQLISSELALRQRILQDVTPLAEFIESGCDLRARPSKGIQVLPTRAESVVEHGPGGPALLIADPSLHLSSDLRATSPHDRTVDFWMSDQELDDLYDTLHSSGETGRATGEMHLLRRISESRYEDLIILPDEVAMLRKECEGMSRVSSTLEAAMRRITTICDLAARHHLGMVVPGG